MPIFLLVEWSFWVGKVHQTWWKAQCFLISIYKFFTKFGVFWGEENCVYFGEKMFTKYGESKNLSLYFSKKYSPNLVISWGEKNGIFWWNFCHQFWWKWEWFTKIVVKNITKFCENFRESPNLVTNLSPSTLGLLYACAA